MDWGSKEEELKQIEKRLGKQPSALKDKPSLDNEYQECAIDVLNMFENDTSIKDIEDYCRLIGVSDVERLLRIVKAGESKIREIKMEKEKQAIKKIGRK